MAMARNLFYKFGNYFSGRLVSGLQRSGFTKKIKPVYRIVVPSVRSTHRAGLAFGLVPVVHAVWGFSSKKEEVEEKAPQQSEDDGVIAKADSMYKENAFVELYDFLIEYKACSNDEILWRLARAACDKAKLSTDKEERKKLMNEGLEIVQRALEINDDNFACHKWYAILLDYTAEFEGTKQRLLNAYLCKDHFQRAVELQPTDATSVHLLGFWCFAIADINWYQRKLAAAFFATPPESSFEEALGHFLQAEKVEPNFYSMNLLMIGKCYLKLNDKDNAKVYLMKAYEYPIVSVDDKQAHKESIELLKSIGVTVPR